MLRMITFSRNSFDHLSFWLGSSLGLPDLADFVHYKINRMGRRRKAVPAYFTYLLNLYSDGLSSERFNLNSLSLSTTKDIYVSLTNTMPPPKVAIKHPNINYSLVWKRIVNGVFSKTSRNILYLIVHERCFTRERGFRILPNRYESPNCQNCDCLETIIHKHVSCPWVGDAWGRLTLLATA